MGFAFGPPSRKVWKIRELVSSARARLEREFPDIWFEGEISNFRPADSGHLYFTLKDDGAQVRVVMFRSQARLLRFRPENGLQVIARGRLTIYEDRGEMQVLLEYMEPKGAGALQIAFEQLKAKLATEGLFELSRKKPLPDFPRTVGVVTSPRGAVIQDILNVLHRRNRGINVLLYPAQVQGDSAAFEVSAGVRYFNRAKNADVIIIARGGGSLEDLAAFNNEGLARVIAASELPVISAVGHETDFTICDFVSDFRAPTPSAAAELVTRSRQTLNDQIQNLYQHLVRAMRYELLNARNNVTELTQHRAFARAMDLIRRRQQLVDELRFRLSNSMRTRLQQSRMQLDSAYTRLELRDFRRSLVDSRRVLEAQTVSMHNAISNILVTRRYAVGRLTSQLQALSPTAILERGYALVFDAAGNLVKDATQLSAGDTISARLASGSVQARVEGTKE